MYRVARNTLVMAVAAVLAILALLMTCGYLMERTRPGLILMVGCWTALALLVVANAAFDRRRK